MNADWRMMMLRHPSPVRTVTLQPTRSACRLSSRAAALVLGLVLALPQLARADGDPLPFAKSYTLTGSYAVGGVDLAPQPGGNGFATGTISINGVPANAEILTAFLYWETVSTQI